MPREASSKQRTRFAGLPDEASGGVRRTRQLEAHGVKGAEAARLLKDYDTERISWHLGELERRLRGKHQIGSPAA